LPRRTAAADPDVASPAAWNARSRATSMTFHFGLPLAGC